jgi:hypothetical protein
MAGSHRAGRSRIRHRRCREGGKGDGESKRQAAATGPLQTEISPSRLSKCQVHGTRPQPEAQEYKRFDPTSTLKAGTPASQTPI